MPRADRPAMESLALARRIQAQILALRARHALRLPARPDRQSEDVARGVRHDKLIHAAALEAYKQER